jgi:hypothetical protein
VPGRKEAVPKWEVLAKNRAVWVSWELQPPPHASDNDSAANNIIKKNNTRTYIYIYPI